MNLDELLAKDFFWKNVLVIGLPASGKTFIANKIREMAFAIDIFHTDKYIEFGYEDSLYNLIEELEGFKTEATCIVEGVLGYRLLRKGLEIDCWKPDVVIVCEGSKKRQTEIYAAERDPKKLKYMRSFELGLTKIFNDYMSAEKTHQPEFLTVENNW